jgi:hypothetical protein
LTPSCWHGVTTVVMGNCGFSIAPCRPADRELLMRMLLVVRDALRAGACGFSTSESPTHFFGDGTPAPSRVAPREEIRALASVLGEFGRGITEIAPRHTIGGTDGKSEDQRFYIEVAKACGRPVTWAPLQHSPFDPEGALRLIEEAREAQADGARGGAQSEATRRLPAAQSPVARSLRR